MRNAEFMKLLTAMRELDHHQRKVLSTVLNRQSDGLRVIELIETSFDTKSACPHCANVELYRHGWVSGLQRYYIVSTAAKPSMLSQARRSLIFAISQNG